MDKYILKKAQEMIENNKEEYAKNFIVKEYHTQFDTPNSKKEVDAATHNMEQADKQITWLTNFMLSRSPVKKSKK